MKFLYAFMFLIGSLVSQAYAADSFASLQEANTKTVQYLVELNKMADALKEYCSLENTEDGPTCVRHVPNVPSVSFTNLTVLEQKSEKAELLVLQRNIAAVLELKNRLWRSAEVIPEEEYVKKLSVFDDGKLDEMDTEFNLVKFYAKGQAMNYQKVVK